MVEPIGLPCLDAVAFFALLTQSALVGVIVVVAIVAGRGCVTMLGVLLVAAGAGQAPVRALQRKIGLTMVEGVGVEMDDIGVTTLVIRMADFAGRLIDIAYAAVKSPLVLDVRCYLLMAIEAQAVLHGLAEGLMTFLTGGFPFGMTGNHFARHDQGLQIGRPADCRNGAQGEQGGNRQKFSDHG